MREIKRLFEREFRTDRIDIYEENTNVLTDIKDTSVNIVDNMAELQPAIYGNKMMVKQDGVLKELAIEDNEIILKEI